MNYLNLKTIFLFDAIGAFFSALFPAIILIWFDQIFGIPSAILHKLPLVGCFYFLYSSICFLFVTSKRELFLKIIIAANSLYFVIILGLLIFRFSDFKFLGLIYFTLELVVLAGVIFIEWVVYKKDRCAPHRNTAYFHSE